MILESQHIPTLQVQPGISPLNHPGRQIGLLRGGPQGLKPASVDVHDATGHAHLEAQLGRNQVKMAISMVK